MPRWLRRQDRAARRHELGPHRIGDGFGKNAIDFGLGGVIERPAHDRVDWIELIGWRAPQSAVVMP